MPRKNVVKIYVEDGYYHLYNRGVEKRVIFSDKRDYKTFLYFLKSYLTPVPKKIPPFDRRQVRSLSKDIDLLVYCLMPNHFHLLVKQKSERGITKFMRALCTNYVMYFNQRYQRLGGLFQSAYKAVLVETDEQLLHLSRYIHLNPSELLGKHQLLEDYLYSSYDDYMGKRKTNWLKTETILDYFKTARKTSLNDFLSYQGFVESYKEDEKEFSFKGVTLE
ncbi:MAG TPA: transposase [Candidatus Bathyarchaeia archaeon]|nr:transposase [Candidatus Bathyarchaeia archaeon]